MIVGKPAVLWKSSAGPAWTWPHWFCGCRNTQSRGPRKSRQPTGRTASCIHGGSVTASSRVSGRSSLDVPLQAEGGKAQRPPGKQGHPLQLAPQSVPVLGLP